METRRTLMATREVFGTIGLVDKNVTGGVRLARWLRRDARHQLKSAAQVSRGSQQVA